MSSAILYLAIVAIWAGVLMPRWLQTPHDSRTVAENHFESVDPNEAVIWAEHDEDDSDEDFHDRRAAADPEAGQTGRRERRTRVEPRRERARPVPDEPGERAAAWFVAADRRARVLQARRRMFAALIVLTSGAVGIAVAHMAAPWVVIPPAAMLVVFMLLLHEAARTDAERAWPGTAQTSEGMGRAAAHAEADVPAAQAEHGVPGTRPDDGTHDAGIRTTRTEPGVSAPDPAAEIIDISGRLGDQLYDQYTDAAARAVGD